MCILGGHLEDWVSTLPEGVELKAASPARGECLEPDRKLQEVAIIAWIFLLFPTHRQDSIETVESSFGGSSFIGRDKRHKTPRAANHRSA